MPLYYVRDGLGSVVALLDGDGRQVATYDYDPLDPKQWNRYVYVGNDPVNYLDPTGLSWWSDRWDDFKCGARVAAIAAGAGAAHFLGMNNLLKAIGGEGASVGALGRTIAIIPPVVRGAAAALGLGLLFHRAAATARFGGLAC